MKIVFQTPEMILIESMGNKLSVVDVPVIERQALLRVESRKARKIAEKELFDQKEELLAREFDVQEYCKAWWQGVCDEMQNELDMLIVGGVDAKFIAQKEKRLSAALNQFSQPNTQWATFFAQKNNGEKPVQNHYEKELKNLADTYALLAIRANFVRDESGKPIFENNADPVGDYTPQKWDIIKLLQLDNELSKTVQGVTSEGLGFIQKVNGQNANPTTETSSQLQNTVTTE